MPNTEEGLLHSVDCECETCLAEVAAYNAKLKRRKGKKRLVREDDVEGTYLAERERMGDLCLKVKVLGRPGYPDRLVIGSTTPAAQLIMENFRRRNGEPIPFEDAERMAEEIVARVLRWAELKKDATSRFQPKQKTIIPMLRKRGITVDLPHG